MVIAAYLRAGELKCYEDECWLPSGTEAGSLDFQIPNRHIRITRVLAGGAQPSGASTDATLLFILTFLSGWRDPIQYNASTI